MRKLLQSSNLNITSDGWDWDSGSCGGARAEETAEEIERMTPEVLAAIEESSARMEVTSEGTGNDKIVGLEVGTGGTDTGLGRPVGWHWGSR